MEEILKNLKKLKEIEPSSECFFRTEVLVKSSPQPKRDFSPFLTISLSLIILIGLIFGLKNKTNQLAIHSKENKETKIAQMDFDLQLPQISYYQETENIISVALNEIINK